MGERPSEYQRDVNDWYVEPAWCVQALAHDIQFKGGIHDPCCGSGTIPEVLGGSGSDIIDRGFRYPVQNYLQDFMLYDNIVTNPPYRMAQEIIEHALKHVKYRVAALVQTKFLSSQKRHGLFMRRDTERIIMFSRRPSMPPGEMLMRHGESIRGNGSIDYCWVVWNRRHDGPCTVTWAK